MKFFIIGGTEKAGTTSLFEYFVNHPQIVASKRKETDFFRSNNCELEDYVNCFTQRAGEHQTYMEASPAYLGLSASVAEQINQVAPQAQMVFLVRDPISRLRSSYLFHRSKLYIPENIDINTYVQYCLAYQRGQLSLADSPFKNPWFLNVLAAGSYQQHINRYTELFGDNVKVINFEHFCKNTGQVVRDIARFLQIDADYFNDYDFFTANKTFQSSNHTLHKLGMYVNNRMEPFFRKNPSLKRKVVTMYQKVNGKKGITGGEFSAETKALLREFYNPDFNWAKNYFANNQLELEWTNFNE
ncbi:sulfotransferase domain-containing protein [Catenovulum agarivorans]|uniref:sulfotransferase domain-containing protein n=1 Tax=Catenovulum agarivorans TaxID=1172192 RepID=UPI0002EC0E95|nr:sulfotransferase domain-containing protein [Catenovulum agarivorans]